MQAGLSLLAAPFLVPHTSHAAIAAAKAPSDVKVLFLVGDVWHNAVRMESHWRRVLGVTGWRLMFAQSSQFVTPELLDEVDLFVFARYHGGDDFGWSPEQIIVKRSPGYLFMTPEQEEAIIRNVTRRGMGIIPFHCSMWNPESPGFMQLMGMKEPLMHGPLMETSFYDLNQSHPITTGVEPYTTEDEIFGVVMDDVDYTPLLRARQNVLGGETLDRLAGWTREVENGRVVMLNCGASHICWWEKSFKEIMWRSAHWAMQMDIPESGLVSGRSVDRE